MIDKTFIEKIIAVAKPDYKELHGVTFANQSMELVRKPSPNTLNSNTLQSVADYANKLTEEGVDFVVHVKSPTEVVVTSKLDEKERTREKFLSAKCPYDPFEFGYYHNVEKFIISLQAQFVKCETVTAILKMVGNMVSRADVGSIDDGVTQVTEVKTGLAEVQKVAVPNPVSLAPFRTFPEIVQPKSNFVLRLKTDQRCALYEADGGTWKIEAIEKISIWLKENIENKDIPIVA